MEVLLNICLAIFAGLIIARLIEPLGLPSVTGYLVAGVLIGPYCLGRLSDFIGFGFGTMEEVESLQLISKIALGFIAFSIGSEFRLEHLRHIGKQATVIAILQAVTATVLVDAALIGLHFLLPDVIPLPAAIVLGAIATATAPAATMMVIKQYKAKGPLTSILLPIVALDDAVGLIVFAVSFGIAKALVVGEIDIFSILVNPMLEIVCSLLLGAIFGFILAKIMNIFHRYDRRVCLALTFVFMTVAICMQSIALGPIHISFSSLLTCMMLGTVFCNVTSVKRSTTVMEETDHWTTIVFVVFFVISGAELELSVFLQWGVVVAGILYIIARSLGKYYGARISSKMMGCSDTIQKYLGITLLPQAGVALGMAVTAQQLGNECGTLVRNITLMAVLIYELVGPLLTKISLIKAGEIAPENAQPKLQTVKKAEAAAAAQAAANAAATQATTYTPCDGTDPTAEQTEKQS
ncbi:MAG: cation:proton antiporter [Clostridia bacterium]|nr:cation:proton antiporter [Clostridia bacterium]